MSEDNTDPIFDDNGRIRKDFLEFRKLPGPELEPDEAKRRAETILAKLMGDSDLKRFLESMIEDIEWIDGKVKPLTHEYVERLNIKLAKHGLQYKIHDGYPLRITVENIADG